MPSTVEELSPTRVKLTIEIPEADLKPAMDKAYKQIAQQINIPGFRRGKVPPAIIDQRVGKGAVLQEAVNDVMPGAYQRALGEHNVYPMGEPEIEVTKLEGETVEFTAELDKRPEFDLPKLADIAVEVDALPGVDEELEERIGVLRERFATQTDVDRAAAEGDLVTVDLEGTRDGEALEDASAEGVSFKVGNSAMLEGLDDAVTGLSAGESATFTSTLVGGKHKDEEADIKVTVTKVAEQKLPELDDEFAQMVSEFDTVDEMKADLREGVESILRQQQAGQAQQKVLETLIEKADLNLPEGVVAKQVEAQHASVLQQLGQAGVTLADYLEQTGDERTEEEFWAELDKNVEQSFKAEMILDKAADEFEVTIEQDDLNAYIMRRAQSNGTSPQDEVNHMMEHGHMQEWMGEIRRSKALGAITAKAKATDTDGKDVDLSILAPVKAEEADDATEAAADDVDAK